MREIFVKVLPHAKGLELPRYATEDSACMDLRAAVMESVLLKAGAKFLCPTGLVLALDKGFEGQIRSRSGLAMNYSVVVLNSPGTIDADYRGEVKVLLINLGSEDFLIERSMRIAQLFISRYERFVCKHTETFDNTNRNLGGFGSTGLS